MAETLETDPSDDVAIGIIEEFYNTFELQGAENELWAMLTIVMAADNEHSEGRDRSNAMFFFEYFSRLNKAIYYLYKDEIEGLGEDKEDSDDSDDIDDGEDEEFETE